jgi:hypothetical protein
MSKPGPLIRPFGAPSPGGLTDRHFFDFGRKRHP